MEIANPIYDVVFKFLMEDSKVAKLFLSAITGFEIITLDFLPHELSSEAGSKEGKKERLIDSALDLSIYRLDFSAKIRQADGSEVVIIIEVQKSKLSNDIMRFRRYLGKQYMNQDFFRWAKSAQDKNYRVGLPILPIYFLGEEFSDFKDHPVLLVDKTLRDRYSKEVLSEENGFVSSLFHGGIIVNIPALSKKRRDDLEVLLSIFDQENRGEDHHIMNVQESDFAERFRPIIRRLQAAAQEKDMRDKMLIEDDFLSELHDYENRILIAEQNFQEASSREEEANRQKEVERRLKEEAHLQKEEANKQKEEANKREEEANKQKHAAIRLMLSAGISEQTILENLGISAVELDRVVNS